VFEAWGKCAGPTVLVSPPIDKSTDCVETASSLNGDCVDASLLLLPPPPTSLPPAPLPRLIGAPADLGCSVKVLFISISLWGEAEETCLRAKGCASDMYAERLRLRAREAAGVVQGGQKRTGTSPMTEKMLSGPRSKAPASIE